MTGHLQSPVEAQYEMNKNHKTVLQGSEITLVPVKTSVDEQPDNDDSKEQAAPATPASKDTTSPAPAAAAPITTALPLPACNPPNIFTSTPNSKLTARRFLSQCQLVFDYTDASANHVQGKMTDQQKILYAASFMRANAGDWVNGWRANPNTEGRTWEQFKKAVVRRFRDKKAATAPAPKMEWSVHFSSIHATPTPEGEDH